VRFTATVVQGDTAADSAEPEILGTHRASVTLALPQVVIISPDSIVRGKSTAVKVSMPNHLGVALTKVKVNVRGFNLDLP